MPNEPVFVQKGEPAPFAGDLLTPEQSAQLIVRVESCEERAAARLAHDLARQKIELGRKLALLKIDLDTARLRGDMYQQETERLDAWYRRPAIVAFVSAVLSATVVMGSAWVGSQLTVVEVSP